MTGGGLEVSRLNVRLGGTPILTDLSATLAAGQIVGVIGPNGAGKSTLLAAIAGLLPFRGTVLFEQAPLPPLTASHLPQAHGVTSGLSVLEVMLLGRREHLGWRIKGEEIDRATAVLREFRLEGLAARAMDTLSGGQQQIVFLAQRLVREPRLLLLDEPTSALDLHHQVAVFDIIKAYVERTGALVMAAIHDLNLAAQHCSEILLLSRGRLIAGGRPQDVLTPERIGDTYRIDVEVLSASRGRRVIVPVSARTTAL